MGKKAFEIERELAAARAEYHEASTSGTETTGQLEIRSDAIKKLVNEVNAFYIKGAVERPEGVKPVGMKRRPGCYEIGNGELRSQGETPEEAVQNWNDGVFFEGRGPGVTVTPAA